MNVWVETTDKVTDVKTEINGITHNIGLIEEGLPSIYMATGLNNETLRNGDTFLFYDFQKAVNAITEAYERSITE
jgi:hypothetical protein